MSLARNLKCLNCKNKITYHKLNTFDFYLGFMHNPFHIEFMDCTKTFAIKNVCLDSISICFYCEAQGAQRYFLLQNVHYNGNPDFYHFFHFNKDYFLPLLSLQNSKSYRQCGVPHLKAFKKDKTCLTNQGMVEFLNDKTLFKSTP